MAGRMTPSMPIEQNGRVFRLRSLTHAMITISVLSFLKYGQRGRFATACSTDRSTMGRWLNGNVQPYAAALWVMAEALDCDIMLVQRKVKPEPLVACAFCGQPLRDANCPDDCSCDPDVMGRSGGADLAEIRCDSTRHVGCDHDPDRAVTATGS